MANPPKAKNRLLNAGSIAYVAAAVLAYLTAFGSLPPGTIVTAFHIAVAGGVLVFAGLAHNVYRSRPARS